MIDFEGCFQTLTQNILTMSHSTEQDQFDAIYKKICRNVELYGYPPEELGKDIKPCKRLKRDSNKRYNILPLYRALTAYKVTFFAANGFIPTQKKEIDHQCGDPTPNKRSKCVEPTHLKIDTRQNNQTRKTCHHYIRVFEKQYRLIFRDLNLCGINGTITVSKVNLLLMELREHKYGKKNRRNTPYFYVTGFTKYYQCPHKRNPCFINYGKFPSHSH